MLEDAYDTVAGLDLVEAALALVPGDQPDAEQVTWPGTALVRAAPTDDGTEVAELLRALAGLAPAAAALALVAGDAPDLPGLLVGKLFRALGNADVAVSPAEGGGLVSLAVRVPVPGWFLAARVGLDAADAVERLAAAAPRRSALALAPGWHRVRTTADIARLDRGLEGWDNTRAALLP